MHAEFSPLTAAHLGAVPIGTVAGVTLVTAHPNMTSEWPGAKDRSDMPMREQVNVDVAGLVLVDPEGHDVALSTLAGVQVVVLLRHRH